MSGKLVPIEGGSSPSETDHKPELLRDLLEAIANYQGAEILGYSITLMVREADGKERPHHWINSPNRWAMIGVLTERIHSLTHGDSNA